MEKVNAKIITITDFQLEQMQLFLNRHLSLVTHLKQVIHDLREKCHYNCEFNNFVKSKLIAHTERLIEGDEEHTALMFDVLDTN